MIFVLCVVVAIVVIVGAVISLVVIPDALEARRQRRQRLKELREASLMTRKRAGELRDSGQTEEWLVVANPGGFHLVPWDGGEATWGNESEAVVMTESDARRITSELRARGIYAQAKAYSGRKG